MKQQGLAILCSYITATLLTSCATLEQNHKRTVCNELKNKLMFSGTTGITRQAEIQSSEDTLLQREYDKNHCDDL